MSTDEIVDIVNEEDVVIGKGSKNYCHANKILHRGAAILIFKDKSHKEILLQKRSRLKKSNPGKWAYVGGHLKSGETYLEGALRELQEEMFHNKKLPPNIHLEELFKIIKYDNDPEHGMIYRTVCKGPFFLDPEEAEEFHFMNIDRLADDLEKNPGKYTTTCAFLTKEYKKRIKQ